MTPRGESLLATQCCRGIVADLKATKAWQKVKALPVVFLDEFKNNEGELMGVIIQKKDGGYLYTTTDRLREAIVMNTVCRSRCGYIDS